MRRSRKTVLTVALIGVLLLSTAGCFRGNNKPAPEPPVTALVTLYFYDAEGELVPVTREVGLEQDTPEFRLRAAMEELIKGPGPDETEPLYNQLPGDAKLLNLEISRPYATLNFSGELDRIGGSMRVHGTLEQLKYTATALDEVSGVFLQLEGERAGTDERPFTGEGVLFEKLYRPADGEWAREVSPAKSLETFMATIGPNVEEMWLWMGPRARELWGTPGNVDWTALAEGLGSWRDYEVVEETIEGDRARVTIRGDQVLEGIPEPDAVYTASMVREDGIWKWNLTEG